MFCYVRAAGALEIAYLHIRQPTCVFEGICPHVALRVLHACTSTLLIRCHPRSTLLYCHQPQGISGGMYACHHPLHPLQGPQTVSIYNSFRPLSSKLLQ